MESRWSSLDPGGGEDIHTNPEGIVATKYFGFKPDSGYRSADTLWPGLGYWVKVNQAGVMVMNTMDVAYPGIPTVDYGGKIYNTVQIGNQCWLKEYLDIGAMIQGVDTASDNGTIEKCCYNNDSANCAVCGGLYQWNEAMQNVTTPGVQGICPPGWHIPTYAEFDTLRSAVSNDGNAFKEVGQGTGGGAGTNTSGFSALLAGYRYTYRYFSYLGYYAFFWSSTESDATGASYLSLGDYSSYIYLYYFTSRNKDYGFSVRCLED